MNRSDFTPQEKARMCEAYREFKEARPGLVDGIASVRSFMNSDYFQWNGNADDIYKVIISRQLE
jgi:hypothetical protein